MKRPTKLQLQILKLVKGESALRMRKRINQSCRQYNGVGISLNWYFQASSKL